MAKKIIIYLSMIFISILNIHAHQQSKFKIEGDSVLHICSDFLPEYWDDNYDPLFDPLFNYSTIIIDEGVKSVEIKLNEKNRFLYLPSSLRNLIDYSPNGIQCDIRLNPKNPYLCTEGCAIYDKQKTTLITSTMCKENSVFNMPSTVDSVWRFPNTHFSKIIFPSGLKCYPYQYLNCDTLVIQSPSVDPSWLAFAISNTKYLDCPFDSLVAKMLVEKDSKYSFHVTTYDTLYRLPFDLKISKKKSEEKEFKYADYGDFKDSVFTIREGVDTLPDLTDIPSHCRKIIIPKSMCYLKCDLYCDSVFIYSDSLDVFRYNFENKIKAKYYYVENEQLYLSLRRRNMGHDNKVVVYSPNADISKRNLLLQKNTNSPVLLYNGKIANSPIRPTININRVYMESSIEGIPHSDLYILDNLGRRYNNKWISLKTKSPYLDLNYAVWTYDTLLTLPQKSHITFAKQDGSIWEDEIEEAGTCLYYVPEEETTESLMTSGKKVIIWKDGDTIPRRYLKRLALGTLYKNGECLPLKGNINYHLFWRNKRNYIIEEGEKAIITLIDKTKSIEFVLTENANHPKEIWLTNITMNNSDCLKRILKPLHFYISK